MSTIPTTTTAIIYRGRSPRRGRVGIDGGESHQSSELADVLTLLAGSCRRSIAISALLIFPLRSDAARLALLSRLRSSSWGFGQDLRGTTGTLIVAAAVFLLVAGIGAAVSYVGVLPRRPAQGHESSRCRVPGRMAKCLRSLKDYARSIGTEEPASMAAAGKLLPDVNTMIERLAARLETAPEDIKGWRMLGWSYFHTGRYEQAATAYARAVELDPNSAELKRLVRGGQGEGLRKRQFRDSLVFANRGRRQGW